MTFQVLDFSRKKIQDFPGGVGTLCDMSPMAAAHWRLQMWQTWAVWVAALFMNWFTLWRARFSWSAVIFKLRYTGKIMTIIIIIIQNQHT